MTPGGPRTLLGESGRGMGTQELRPEAGKSLPLGHLRGGQTTLCLAQLWELSG